MAAKAKTANKSAAKKAPPAKKSAAASDWCAATLARVRALMKEADPEIVETRKWGDTPVFERNGILCTGETYKDKVKLTFAKGAALPDPAGLFNSSLDGNVRRAIDIGEGAKLNEKALKALIRATVALNQAKPAPRKKRR